MRAELEKIDPKLFSKPEIIVLTKTDLVDSDVIKKGEEVFKKEGIPVTSVSIIDDKSISDLRAEIKKILSEN